MRYHASNFQEVHACLAAHVARDRTLPKRARAFAEEGLRDMRRRMKDAKKDALLKAYRDPVREYRDDVRNGIRPIRAHRTFLERKAKLAKKVRGMRIWNRRAYSTTRMAHKIVEHSKHELAVSASAALDRGRLPEDLKRFLLNLSNVSYPVRRPSSSPPPPNLLRYALLTRMHVEEEEAFGAWVGKRQKSGAHVPGASGEVIYMLGSLVRGIPLSTACLGGGMGGCQPVAPHPWSVIGPRSKHVGPTC